MVGREARDRHNLKFQEKLPLPLLARAQREDFHWFLWSPRLDLMIPEEGKESRFMENGGGKGARRADQEGPVRGVKKTPRSEKVTKELFRVSFDPLVGGGASLRVDK